MEIRFADKNDIDMLMSIRLEMLRIVNGKSADYRFDDELVDNSRRYFLEGDQMTALAIDNGKAVACASISYIEIMPTFSHPTGKRAYILNVYTNTGHRRQGIARQMMNMLISDARARGVTEICLDATEQGRPLYEAMGFKESDEYMVMAFDKE